MLSVIMLKFHIIGVHVTNILYYECLCYHFLFILSMLVLPIFHVISFYVDNICHLCLCYQYFLLSVFMSKIFYVISVCVTNISCYQFYVNNISCYQGLYYQYFMLSAFLLTSLCCSLGFVI